MQSLKYLGSLVAVAWLLSLGAFAKDVNSGSFDLAETAHVGSTVLQPGHYKAEWSGPKDAVTVSILHDGKTVATTQAKVKELPAKAPYSSVTVKTLDNNTTQVDEIDFNHRSEALVLSGM